MKIVGIRGSIKAIAPLAEGMSKHGDEYVLAESVDDPVIEIADAFVQTNMLKPKHSTKNNDGPYDYILKSGLPFLVHESPNFRKHTAGEWSRLGWYSYQWTNGLFGNTDSPDDRWKKFQAESNIQLKDWSSPGDKIIIMAQKPGDSSLYDLHKDGFTFNDWVRETVLAIKQYTDRPITVRPHPRGLKKGYGELCKLAEELDITISDNITKGGNQGGDGLEADCQQAHCIVTYNSLSAIEAVCDGIPVFAMHNGSMAWPVAHHDLSQIENLDYNIDRTQWCNDIAYTQWNATEQRSGEAWAHLKPLIFK